MVNIHDTFTSHCTLAEVIISEEIVERFLQ